MEQMIIKDCEVEVCPEEEGYRGAWYRAILEETPTNPGGKKLRVRYMTLFNEDGSSRFTEQSFIRPVPPENLYKGVVLEEGLLVDADYKAGWWTGVVIKNMEDDNCLVYFDFPPDIVQFERKHLRAHLDWTGSKWVRPEIKKLSKSMFSPGTLVEVSCVIDKVEVTWCTAMIIKETDEKKFFVKVCNNHLGCNGGDEAKPNSTVDSHCVRPIPPPFPIEAYNLLDCVEALRGSSWCQGLVMVVLTGKQYMVRLEAKEEDLVFKHSDHRPLKVWENGVWYNGPKQKPVIGTASNVVKEKPMCSSSDCMPMAPEENGETLTVASTGAVMNETTPLVVTPEVASIPKQSVSPLTPLKQTEKSPEKTFEAMKTQNGLVNDSTRKKLSEENGKDGSRKRKREQKHNSDLNETDWTRNEAEFSDTGTNICNDDDVDDQPLSTKLSSCQIPDVVNRFAADVEETQAKGAQIILPFAKKLPFWKTYETNEIYKTVQQCPHFSGLLEVKEDLREWSAIGMMVTFYELLEEVKNLQLDVSSSNLSSLSSFLAELEKQGFHVATLQSRIRKLLSIQEKRAKKAEQRKYLEKKSEAAEIETQKFEEELAELERKLLELKRQGLVAKEKKEEAAKRIVKMKSCADTIDQDIKDVELEFQTTALVPW